MNIIIGRKGYRPVQFYPAHTASVERAPCTSAETPSQIPCALWITRVYAPCVQSDTRSHPQIVTHNEHEPNDERIRSDCFANFAGQGVHAFGRGKSRPPTRYSQAWEPMAQNARIDESRPAGYKSGVVLLRLARLRCTACCPH